MHLALYRSERPERFNEIIGQKHIVRILQHQLETDNVSQAYLFTGTRGTGKTTTARILAKALNCTGNPADGQLPCGECENCKAIKDGRFLDVIEMDAASNNGVDDIRDLIDRVNYPPMVGRYKVYIIDEVHMLSTSAENAFLKTLEEPPEHVIFILATTNPEKVRETIRSRCMRLDFRRVSEEDLIEGMARICRRKQVNITRDALALVAQKADGSVRDGLSILEQCISGGDALVDLETVEDYLGSAGLDFYLGLTQNVIEHNMAEALKRVGDALRTGCDAKQIFSDWLEHYRNLMVVRYVDDAKRLINASEENIGRMRLQASQMDADSLEVSIRLLSEYINLARYSTQPRILLETAALHLMNGKAVPSSKVAEMLQLAKAELKKVPLVPAVQAVPAEPKMPAEPKAASEPAETVPEPSAPAAAIPETPAAVSTAAKDTAPAVPENSDAAETSFYEDGFDPEAVWDRIVDIVAQDAGASFRIMVGSTSRIESYRNGELSILVKANKIDLANDSKAEIQAAARQILGEHAVVTLRSDDGKGAPTGTAPARDVKPVTAVKPSNPPAAEPSRPIPEVPAYPAEPEFGIGDEGVDEIVPSDYNMMGGVDYPTRMEQKVDIVTEIAEEAGNLFGTSVEIID
ncbi:MAG: DNA polymerase III subunit gamma/tau [Clostridia bacterium]|nr:DNA polymerase III subunit gamma/tau [Clostridia bacterium]